MTDLLEKRISNIHGSGILTKRKIYKNEKFYTIHLDNISNENSLLYAYIGNGQYVSDQLLNWVNHSCSPNCFLDIKERPPVLIALRDILPNEEITCDYEKSEVEVFKFECNCRNDDCRRNIGKKNNPN